MAAREIHEANAPRQPDQDGFAQFVGGGTGEPAGGDGEVTAIGAVMLRSQAWNLLVGAAGGVRSGRVDGAVGPILLGMCGRYTHQFSWKQIHRLLSLTTPEIQFEHSYNVAPTLRAPIVRDLDMGRGVEMAVWGLKPTWSDGRVAPINARSESVATSPMFRGAFKSRRCVVAASGFYEWQRVNGSKQPWYITRADGEAMLLAGLFEIGHGGTTFTIITTSANTLMGTIHDRMPAVLEPESVQRWLAEPDASLLRPAADGVLMAHPVSTRVNSPKNNDATLIQPADRVPPDTLF